MSDDLLRVYLDPDEIGEDGYPFAWHGTPAPNPDYPHMALTAYLPRRGEGAIKDLIREQAGHRCVRCGHPYTAGNPRNSRRGEWSPCDELCTHGDPARDVLNPFKSLGAGTTTGGLIRESHGSRTIDAQWRILTVHHLNGIKHDCTWGNLAALCQRCHLSVQTRVVMGRPYNRPHSDWFKPYAAFHYARVYLGEELSREEVVARLDELLDLELRQDSLFS